MSHTDIATDSCAYCGDTMTADRRRKYCSRRCKDLSWQQRHGWCKSIKAYSEWKQRGFRGKCLTCVICGKGFTQTGSHQKYCGKKCLRVSEYFVRRYGTEWRLAKSRFELSKELSAFKREVQDNGT